MTNNLLLQDLIKVYDEVLPPENCKQLINFFESQEKYNVAQVLHTFLR